MMRHGLTGSLESLHTSVMAEEEEPESRSKAAPLFPPQREPLKQGIYLDVFSHQSIYAPMKNY